jgi:hypothetical protein
MIRVIVKGDFSVAVQAAAERGMPFQLRNEVPSDSETLSVGYVVEMRHWEKVVAWYLEPVQSEPGKGFPPGSLLHYAMD